MRFRCVSEVRADDAGATQSVEVRWNERRVYAEEVVLSLGMLMLGLAAVAVAVFGWRGLDTNDVPLIAASICSALFLFCAASWCCAFAVEMKGNPRALTLMRDGTVRGFSSMGPAQDRASRLLHTGIVSIAEREFDHLIHPFFDLSGWGVELEYRTGHIVTIAERLTRADAQRLAGALTVALNDLRESTSNPVEERPEEESAASVSVGDTGGTNGQARYDDAGRQNNRAHLCLPCAR